MAKRGYTQDTIRGGASDWDVSRPFSSAIRMLGSLLGHPIRFFEVLPRVPDIRAPGLFLVFFSVVSAIIWFFVGGFLPAALALVLPVPVSLVLAGLWHLGSWGGRHDFVVTWRMVVYPLGFSLPLVAIPFIRWLAIAYAGAGLLSVGTRVVREVSAARAALVSVVITTLAVSVMWFLIPGW